MQLAQPAVLVVCQHHLLMAPRSILELLLRSVPLVLFPRLVQVTSTTVKFTVVNEGPAAPLTYWGTKLLGHFTDNLVNIPACSNREFMFVSHQGPVTPEEVASSITIHDLYTYQQEDASAPASQQPAS